MTTSIIIIIISIIVELILGFIIIKNPNRFIGKGKPDLIIKIFIFIILSIMILSMIYLTISSVKG